MISRRGLLAGSVTLLAAPRAAGAQQAAKIWRIGILSHSSASSEIAGPKPQSMNVYALLRGLRELGYTYGEHFVTEARGGEAKPERYRALASELVRLRADVIVASGQVLSALREVTSTIPIVMAASGDPVGEGLVQSLAQPGRNFTGLSHQMVETTAKRLELLKELVPGSAPIAIIRDEGGALTWRAVEAAAQSRGWKLSSFVVRNAGDLEGAFRAAADARASAVLVTASGAFFRHARRIAELAAKHRLPAMYSFRLYTDVGGLMSYGSDLIAIWHRAAFFVDKILKGAKPADLPIEQPTKLELAINLRTARALGLTIPPSLLLRADQVIE